MDGESSYFYFLFSDCFLAYYTWTALSTPLHWT